MTSDSIRHSSGHFQALAELELVALVLNQSETPLPWLTIEDAPLWAELEALEQEVAETWSTDDFAPYVQSLATTFDAAWDALPSNELAAVFPPHLFQQFTSQMPNEWVQQIRQRADQAIAQTNALADQLVFCVSGLLPGFVEDDLQVLARPFAYAMRSGQEAELMDGALQSVCRDDWQNLSEVDKARLSLAIARYVISQTAPGDAATEPESNR
jgi:hypothetical protein